MKDKINSNNNFNTIVKWASIFILIGGMKLSRPIIVPLFLSFFISVTLNYPISWLEIKKIPRNIAVILVLILFFGAVYLEGKIIWLSLSSFIDNISKYKEILIERIHTNPFLAKDLGLELLLKGGTDMNPEKSRNFLFSTISSAKQAFAQFGLIFILTLFLTFELDAIPIKINAILGKKVYNERNQNIFKIRYSIRRYLGIKTLTSFATGLLIFIFLKWVGVHYAILWAMLAFLLNFIPNIGSMIAAAPAIIFTWIQLGPDSMIIIGLVYLFVNLIIGSIIEPKILGKDMGISTFVVFLSMVFWGWVMGPIGMFLAVPLTMVLKILVESNKSSAYMGVLLGTKKEALIKIKENKNTGL